MSKQQPLWHLAVLSIFTCSIYLVFWAYRAWRDLKQEALAEANIERFPALERFKSVNPWLNTFGLLAPVFISTMMFLPPIARFVLGTGVVIFFYSKLIYGIARLNPDKTSPSQSHPVLCTAMIMLGFALLLATVHLPGALYLLTFTAGLPFVFAQQWLNNFWAEVEPAETPVRIAFSFTEILIIIIGGGLLGLIVAGMMIGVPGS